MTSRDETTATFRVDQRLLDELRELAERHDRSVSAELREAVRERLEQHREEQ
jgi:predicted transcriptional regulator